MIKELTKEQRSSPLYSLYDEFIALKKVGLLETAAFKFPKFYYGKRKSVLYFKLKGEM